MDKITTSGVHSARNHQVKMFYILSKNNYTRSGKTKVKLSKGDFNRVKAVLEEAKLIKGNNEYKEFIHTGL